MVHTDPATSIFSKREMFYAAVAQFILCAALIALVSRYPGQNTYSFISEAIRHWDFRAVPPDQPREFWGLSYLSAAIAAMTSVSDATAILIIDFCGYLVTIFLCERLWGGVVAAWFATVNWSWLDAAVECGSEPLFMSLLLGSFLAVRQERWVLATTLTSCATVVRPVGLFALIAIGIVLLRRHEIRRLLIAASIGTVIGVLYLVPLQLIYGNPLAGIRSYQAQDWAGASPVTIPLLPIVKGAIFTRETMRLPLKVLVAFWVLLTVAAMVRLAFSKRFHHYAAEHPIEAIFVGLYSVFLFSYNTNFWVWQHFPRFAIPLLPFILLAFRNRLSPNRVLLCGVAIASIICAVLPKVGVENVSRVIHKLITIQRTTPGEMPVPPSLYGKGVFTSASCRANSGSWRVRPAPARFAAHLRPGDWVASVGSGTRYIVFGHSFYGAGLRPPPAEESPLNLRIVAVPGQAGHECCQRTPYVSDCGGADG